MKKNINIIFIIIISSVIFSVMLLKGDVIYKILQDKADIMIEDMKNKKDIKKYKREGYVVLKDGSLWYKIEEDKNKVTLINAYPLNENGKITKDNLLSTAYNKNCLENCDISKEESKLIPMISKKFLEPLINVIGRKDSESIVIRQVSLDDLKKIGCDINNLTCENAPSWVSEYPFWTNITIIGTNKVLIVDKDKKIKEQASNMEAYVRFVLVTDKINIY